MPAPGPGPPAPGRRPPAPSRARPFLAAQPRRQSRRQPLRRRPPSPSLQLAAPHQPSAGWGSQGPAPTAPGPQDPRPATPVRVRRALPLARVLEPCTPGLPLLAFPRLAWHHADGPHATAFPWPPEPRGQAPPNQPPTAPWPLGQRESGRRSLSLSQCGRYPCADQRDTVRSPRSRHARTQAPRARGPSLLPHGAGGIQSPWRLDTPPPAADADRGPPG